MLRQNTLSAEVSLPGIGLHSGEAVRATIQPAAADSGIVFASTNGVEVPAHARHVVDTTLATTLGCDGWKVATVEHLLAALVCEGVDNARIVVEGGEVPALDGSARPWVDAIRAVGRTPQDAPWRRIVVRRSIEVRDGDRVARLLPAAGFEVSARIVFNHPTVGEQRLDLCLQNGTFGHELAWARTFGFLHEVDYLQKSGLARGGGLDNAVVYGPDGPLNPEGLRGVDEAVRHKMLDMVGDLALAGLPVIARFEADLPGHALNRRLVLALLEQTDSWELAVG
jgi:UDP-3-O-[3-hydroxymyristoyl] N-acetylglucosamine deacetylase